MAWRRAGGALHLWHSAVGHHFRTVLHILQRGSCSRDGRNRAGPEPCLVFVFRSSGADQLRAALGEVRVDVPGHLAAGRSSREVAAPGTQVHQPSSSNY